MALICPAYLLRMLPSIDQIEVTALQEPSWFTETINLNISFTITITITITSYVTNRSIFIPFKTLNKNNYITRIFPVPRHYHCIPRSCGTGNFNIILMFIFSSLMISQLSQIDPYRFPLIDQIKLTILQEPLQSPGTIMSWHY